MSAHCCSFPETSSQLDSTSMMLESSTHGIQLPSHGEGRGECVWVHQ